MVLTDLENLANELADQTVTLTSLVAGLCQTASVHGICLNLRCRHYHRNCTLHYHVGLQVLEFCVHGDIVEYIQKPLSDVSSTQRQQWVLQVCVLAIAISHKNP